MRLFAHAAILLALAAPLSAHGGRSHARGATPDPVSAPARGESGAAQAGATDKRFDLALAESGARTTAPASSRADSDTEGKEATAAAADDGAGRGDTERK